LVTGTIAGDRIVHVDTLRPFLHLRKIQLDGRRATQDLHRHLQAVLLVVHALDHAVEIVERAVRHAHHLARLEQHLRPRLVDAFLDTVAGSGWLPSP
jgi:hypothetical protein